VCSVCRAGRRFGVCQWRFGLSANPVCFQFFSVSVLDVVTQPRGGGRREAPIYEDLKLGDSSALSREMRETRLRMFHTERPPPGRVASSLREVEREHKYLCSSLGSSTTLHTTEWKKRNRRREDCASCYRT